MKDILLFLLHRQACRNRREIATGHTEARVTGCMDKSKSRPQLVSISFPKKESLAVGKKRSNGNLSLGILTSPSTPQMTSDVGLFWSWRLQGDSNTRVATSLDGPGVHGSVFCEPKAGHSEGFEIQKLLLPGSMGFALWVLNSCMKSGPSLWLPWFLWELHFLFLYNICGLLKGQSSASVWESRLLYIGHGAIYLEVSIPYEV